MKRDKPAFLAGAICNVSNCSSHRSVLGQQRVCRDGDKATETKRLEERRIKLKSRYFPFITMETAQPASFQSQRSQGHWHSNSRCLLCDCQASVIEEEKCESERMNFSQNNKRTNYRKMRGKQLPEDYKLPIERFMPKSDMHVDSGIMGNQIQ